MSGNRGPQVELFSDLDALSSRAAELFTAAAAAAIDEKGRFSVAISGGTTPLRLYRLLAEEEYKSRIDWERVHLFWADERCVPASNPDSNFGAARATFLTAVPIPSANIHPIAGELDPPLAARAYEEQLRRFFPEPVPVFDLILLGMGADGHTASLFPDSPALTVIDQLALDVYVAERDSWRVTLTLPVLNAACAVLFLVAGKDKGTALREVLSIRNPHCPATLVRPRAGSVSWLVDSAAAELLQDKPTQ